MKKKDVAKKISRYPNNATLVRSEDYDKDIAKHIQKSSKMGKHIPDITRKDEKKVMRSIDKKGFYASPAAKKAMKESDRKYKAYSKERDARYKREGLSD